MVMERARCDRSERLSRHLVEVRAPQDIGPFTIDFNFSLLAKLLEAQTEIGPSGHGTIRSATSKKVHRNPDFSPPSGQSGHWDVAGGFTLYHFRGVADRWNHSGCRAANALGSRKRLAYKRFTGFMCVRDAKHLRVLGLRPRPRKWLNS